MPAKNKIIVLRFSAMGDVAMVAAVLREFSMQNEVELVMVSRPAFKPFFDDIPNLTFHAIHPQEGHKGVLGLYRLYKELRAYRPIAIADLHDNLRSRLISSFFRLGFYKIRRIDKGRSAKKALTRTHNKVLKPLKSTVERYAEVFRDLGFNLQLSHQLVRVRKELPAGAINLIQGHQRQIIGISPFAQHHYKLYPLAKMEIVLRELAEFDCQVFIFGGGNSERNVAEKWQDQFSHVKSLIGRFTLKEELAIISHLDLMVSMDSSGMHMASLMGVPVVSIWGPTHPYAGFLGYGQQLEDCIQITHPARPSSIYGNKPCLCGSEPCIEQIEPKVVVNKIKEKLSHG
ncbi:glycosyltransferase family 9 protein [Pedobacter insulae]|uniref:ADP-heptose:LPS heptosyltransferase n=1 Tax=Pedobacter insulae TaxID=414048 RepID=A0A1I2YI22_9SPHI|nr:glycosyltransferase family 9 protein [Pedobacter insulae]SFH25313.1 ADP-heptose:LPS heptosyltransferase [Pedobacter insulae]